jgi:hypothetical protein
MSAPRPVPNVVVAHLADAVDGEDRRFLERRRIERGCRVGDVVLGEKDGHVRPDFLFDAIGEEELLGKPDRHGGPERGQSLRSAGEIGLEQALELQERLVIERNGVQLVRPDPSNREARFHRILREFGVVLDAGEALFLGGGDDFPVPNQAGG